MSYTNLSGSVPECLFNGTFINMTDILLTPNLPGCLYGISTLHETITRSNNLEYLSLGSIGLIVLSLNIYVN